MLPPYDSRETLDRITALVRHTGARGSLPGRQFPRCAWPARLDAGAADRLTALARLVDWVWITGNHDEKDGAAAGTMLPELTVGGVMLRHEARPGEPLPELSGHFHPRLRVARAAARSAALAR
jgi:metallophosphoesterase superfamily enzyme